MLVNMNEVLPAARKNKYAVGLFNAVNLELARGIIEAAEQTGSPVIMGTAEVLLPYTPLEEVAYYLIPMAKKAKVPVVVHFDHGLKKETCIKALDLGFSSIMYDCSTDGYETNVQKVKEMTEIAHAYGATVEGELGHVGDNEGSAEGNSNLKNPSAYYTDPMDFNRIRQIANTIDTPLVLHGGSGLTDSDFKKAIECGISKVNIFTDINIAAVEAALSQFSSMNKGIIDLIPATVAAVKAEVIKKMELFGSVHQAKNTISETQISQIVEQVLRELNKK